MSKPNQIPYLALPIIEATCEHCGEEMEVEMPSGVMYQNPGYWDNYQRYEDLSDATRRKSKADVALEMINHVITTFDDNIKGSFRKKTRKMLVSIQHEAEHAARTYRDEWYNLYNELYPSVGEKSTD